MHPATCDQCHSPCEVPFRPTGQQPVLCFECFRRKEGRDTRPRSGGQRFDRTDRYEKPSFRSAPRGHDDDVARQLKALNEKMDMIIEALSQDPDADGDDDELSFE
ncbi:hypothetical protein KJ611_01365 [Patescibacteria group bacterium]|nr:hypothetical protein [Patescibacteria group bacterium]